MASIKSGKDATILTVDPNSQAARVTLYDPQGNALVSFIRGTGVNLNNSGGQDMRDVFGIGVPGPSGALVAGTSTTPLRTDPTGATTQPVSGTVAVSNLPVTQPVSGSVNVGNFPATQQVAGAVNATVRVGGADATAANPLPTSVQSGTLNANLRVAGAAVDATNAVPTTVQSGTVTVSSGTVAVASDATTPVFTRAVLPDMGPSYSAFFDIAPTALTSGVVFFALRNNGSKTIYLRRLDIQQGFTGTAAASRSAFEFIRFSGTPTGGSATVPAKKNTADVASTATIASAAGGLTVTSLSYDFSAFHRAASPNQLAATTTQEVDFGDVMDGWMQFKPNEGLAIRASGAIVAGAFIVGSLGWREL